MAKVINAKAAKTTCSSCSRAMKKAHAVSDGHGYCQSCYKREFRPVACESCGKKVFTLGGRRPAVCKTCQTRDRRCVRCAKLTPHAGLKTDGGVACPSCAKYFKEPKACPVCGRMSLRLARDFKNGFNEPVCEHCQRKGHITCAVCRKHRRPAGMNEHSKLVCKKCLESAGKPFICPLCGLEGQRHSACRCASCYWRDYAKSKVKDSITLLRGDWLRHAFEEFCQEVIERIPVRVAALRMERYFLFFAKMDAAFDHHSEITADRLVRCFGAEGLRRHAVPYGFLLKAGVIPKYADEVIQTASEMERCRKLLQQAERMWYEDLLNAFYQHMLLLNERYRRRGWVGDRQRFIPHTMRTNLFAALKFLTSISESLGAESVPSRIQSVQQIQQAHLDQFVCESPGYRGAIRTFVRYLNRYGKLFQRLKVESSVRPIPLTNILGRIKYNNLLNTWLSPSDDILKESLICVLMLLYAQKVKNIVKLKLSDLSRTRDGVYRVAFGKTELTLNRRVGALLDRYLLARRALSTMDNEWDNPYLFTGRRHGEHLDESTIAYYFKKYKVSAKMLFSTALYYAYLSGLRHPKVLVRAFGISNQTAIRYLSMIDARLRDEVELKAVNG